MTVREARQVSGAIGAEAGALGGAWALQESQHAGAPTGWIEGMLSAGEVVSQSFATWAWRYLLAHLFYEYTELMLERGHRGLLGLVGPVMLGLALLSTFAGERLSRLSKPLAFLCVVAQVALNFPANANHDWLALVVLLTFMLVNVKRPEERALLVAMGRWTIALLILHSGLQKILHGTYFDGMLLATYVNGGTANGFRAALEWLLEPSEFQRLSAAMTARSEGPYQFTGWLPLIASNAVYVAELAAGLALLWRKTRMAGAIAAVAVLVGIEFVARELTFGLLGLNLLMLFFPVVWRARVAVVSLVAYIGLLVAQAVVGPHVYFFS